MRPGTVIVLLSLLSLARTDWAWPDMYRCTDASNRNVFTDSPAELQGCKTIERGTSVLPVQMPRPALPTNITHGQMPVPADTNGTSVQDKRSAPGHVTVPVQRSGQLLVVQTQLNGSRDARLILDTGASHTILSHSVARDLGLLSGGSSTSITLKTAGGSVQAEMTQLSTLRVGEAEASNVAVAVHDLPDAPPGIDGLLGLTFLNQFLVTLDTQKGELHLGRRD